VRRDDIMINITCLEKGIVPFCGGRTGHIVETLESLSAPERRKATRKFRKLLKKAIHRRAYESSRSRYSESYYTYRGQLKEACGLNQSYREKACKITTAQSNFRAALVRQYLENISKLDS
jgi:hypothetical protein